MDQTFLVPNQKLYRLRRRINLQVSLIIATPIKFDQKHLLSPSLISQVTSLSLYNCQELKDSNISSLE